MKAMTSKLTGPSQTLFSAVQQSNNENVVRALIDAGADVNETDDDGKTALFCAVQQSNNENVVRALIDAGADVNKTDDNDGKTALFYAVQQSNNENVVRALIETGSASPNIRDSYGRTPLFYAWKYPTTFEYLLGRVKGNYWHLRDNMKVSIFIFVIESILSSMPNAVDAASNHLGRLIKNGIKKESIVKSMLNLLFCKMPLVLGSDDDTCCRVMHLASLCQNLHYYFSSAYKKLKKIVIMSESDLKNKEIFQVLELLIELGADPNSTDSDGNTALHYATRLPMFGIPQDIVMDMCVRLQEYGIAVDMKNNEGQTPLLYCLSEAVMKDELTISQLKTLVQVCTFLVERGSSVVETSRSGDSVYHLMMKLFQKALEIVPDDTRSRDSALQETMKLLHIFTNGRVSKGSIVNKPDGSLNSPVHLWASLALPLHQSYNSYITADHTFETLLKEILQNLVRIGAKLNLRNENEETPLHLCRTWSAVKLLLDAGANPKDVDSSGRSALMAAANKTIFLEINDRFYTDTIEDQKAFLKTAIEKGLDPYAVDQHGDSVLSILVKSGNLPLSKALVEVACEENYIRSESIFTSLLNSICKDKSKRNYIKLVLMKDLLKYKKSFTLPSTPLLFCCRNLMAEFEEGDGQGFQSLDNNEPGCEVQLKTIELQNSVHYKIARLLIHYGADPTSVDSSGKSCVDLAESCPTLKDLLTKPIDINTIEVVIPWTSVSKKYEGRLAKVASQQQMEDCEYVDSFCYHKEYIGSGSFGYVFAGINLKDGREVAIKRVETLRMNRPQDKREITNLTKLADCEQVVRYLHFLEKGDFSFVILELMEGNLDDYFQEFFSANQAVKLCEDVALGVKFLHEQNIIHRDLKPTNILYKTHQKLCLKIADFGLSKCINILGKTTVYDTNAGTRCWIAPEALESGNHTKSSDVFSCGLLLHYILSKRKHPFSPVDIAGKAEFQITLETETNVVNGRMEGWDDSLSPKATDLVKPMLTDEKNRPTAKEATQHPLFWSKKKKIEVLSAVGNQPEFQCPRTKRKLPLTAVETDLENRFGVIVRYATWNDQGYANMPDIYKEMTGPKGRRYDTFSVVELVRFIRNAYSHVSEDKRTEPSRKMLLEDFVFLEHFPQLVLEVYKAVTTHEWDQTREEVKYAINN